MIGGDCGSEMALDCSWWGTPPAVIGERPSPAALLSSGIVPSNSSLFLALNHLHFSPFCNQAYGRALYFDEVVLKQLNQNPNSARFQEFGHNANTYSTKGF